MTEASDADRTPPTDAADEATPEAAAEGRSEVPDGPDEAALEAFDLDGDGRISLAEDFRAGLGIADARAEELADQPGLKGKAAKAAHRLLDKLDND